MLAYFIKGELPNQINIFLSNCPFVFSFHKEHQFELFVYWLASVTAL